jgi:hypothetical protein
MRRFSLSLLMSLLMLLSQQGMVWHEIGHLSNPPAEQGQKQKPVGDKLCEVCYAFAHLGAAAVPEMPALALADLGHVHALAQAVSVLIQPAPAARSRGPPALL